MNVHFQYSLSTDMQLLSLLGLPYCTPNPTRHTIRTSSPLHLSIALAAASNRSEDFLRRLSASSVFLVGLGFCSFWAFSHPAFSHISPLPSSSQTQDAKNLGDFENLETFEDEDTKLAFERWKSKSYALTVPLRIVALEGSLPPVWIREFLRSQGKRVRFRPEFRRSVRDIFHELSDPFPKGKIYPKSAVAADLITLSESWLNLAIGKGLVEPVIGALTGIWILKAEYGLCHIVGAAWL